MIEQFESDDYECYMILKKVETYIICLALDELSIGLMSIGERIESVKNEI